MPLPPAVAAAPGSLILLLLRAIPSLPGPPRGHTVRLARNIDCPGGFRDPLLLALLSGGRCRSGNEVFLRPALPTNLRAVFESRAGRLLFVRTIPRASFGHLAAGIGAPAGVVGKVALLARSVEPCYEVVFPPVLHYTPNPLSDRIRVAPWP